MTTSSMIYIHHVFCSIPCLDLFFFSKEYTITPDAVTE